MNPPRERSVGPGRFKFLHALCVSFQMRGASGMVPEEKCLTLADEDRNAKWSMKKHLNLTEDEEAFV